MFSSTLASNKLWQISHILCILAQVGLTIVSIALFVVNSQSDVPTFSNEDTSGGFGTPALSWVGGGIGIFGTGATAITFTHIRRLQLKAIGNQTESTRSFNLNTVYFISIFLHILVFGAEIAVAIVEGKNVGKQGNLAGILALACLAGVLALATSLTDFIQLRQLRQI